MKMLGKIKLCVLSAFLVSTMSSCLKTDDPEFGVYQYQYYIIQTNSGEGAAMTKQFQPYAKFAFNEPVASTPTLRSASGDNIFLKAINSSFYVTDNSYAQTFPTLPLENYILTATNAEGATAIMDVPFNNVTLADTLGNITVTDWKYDGTNLSFKVNEVKNAYTYLLVITENGLRSELQFTRQNIGNEINLNAYLKEGTTYGIRIGALSRKGVLIETPNQFITIGKDPEK